MEVITAIQDYKAKPDDVLCFLAGGITDCPDWQKDVLKKLEMYDMEHLIVFNPRRDNFPINDPNASEEQIVWEFKWLEQMDIFAMFFCKSNSIQPICLYELGRNVVRMQQRYPESWLDRIIVTCEEGYLRKNDVDVQMRLALGPVNRVLFVPSYFYAIDSHAYNIFTAYTDCLKERR